MKSSQLNQVLRLARRTGDRVVVMDQETDEVVVMMRLPEYERLVDDQFFNETFFPDPDISRGREEWGGDGDELDEDEEEIDFGHDEISLNDLPNSRFGDSEPEEISFHDESEFSTPADHRAPQAVSQKTVSLDDDWGDTASRPAAPSQGVDDIPHEENDPPFYLEPVE